jgi:hypothetical protein
VAARPPRWSVGLAVAAALLLCGTAVVVRDSARAGPAGWYGRALAAIAARGVLRQDLYYDAARWADGGAVRLAGASSAGALLAAGAWMGGVASIALLSRSRPRAVHGLLLLATAELFVFARGHQPVAPSEPPLPAEWSAALDELPEGQRFLRNPSVYDALVRRWPVLDGWGYDPGVLRRYAELMYAGQGHDPDQVRSDLEFRYPTPGVLRAARIGLVLEQTPAARAHVLAPPPLPHALLVPTARVLNGRDEILRALVERDFDPARTVLLESQPGVRPDGDEPVPVPVRIVDSDTRDFDLQVEAASILLVTESYSRHWMLTPRAPAPPAQGDYRVLPGDWAFLAIPLAAGRHVFRLEYAPRSVAVGRLLSLASLGVCAALAALLIARARRERRDLREESGAK